MAEQFQNQTVWLKRLFLLILFLVSYGIVWMLGTAFFKTWASPMHWLIPIPAFFFAFWAYDWVENFFEVKLGSWWFPVLLLVLGLLAFLVNAWFYYCNGFSGLSQQGATSLGCDSEGSKRAVDFIGANWWNLLIQDAFFYFWIAIFLGWLSKIIWLRAIHPAQAVESKKAKKRK